MHEKFLLYIFLKETNMPSFMLEQYHQSNENNLDSPLSKSVLLDDDKSNLSLGGLSMNSSEFTMNSNDHFHRTSSVSSSVSVGVNNHQHQTRIGYMKCLQIFFFHSSNLLLNKTNFQRDKIKNVCCFTLEIYKLFIRKIKMDYYTWTMLITILLKVAEFLFNSEYLVNNRTEPATSHLIKLTTETVLLAIVKASFSFNLSVELWDQLMALMSSVSSNPDVIDKWIEVIDDLIRQVLKNSYNIDINNLPTIETDKRKIKKKTLYPTSNSPSTTGSFISNNNLQQQHQHQQQSFNLQTKPRSKTEIFSPSSSTTTLVNSPIVPHHSIHLATQSPPPLIHQQQQQHQQQQISLAQQPQHTASIQKSTSTNSSSNSQGSITQSISSSVNVPAAVSAVQPLLSRQRKIKHFSNIIILRCTC